MYSEFVSRIACEPQSTLLKRRSFLGLYRGAFYGLLSLDYSLMGFLKAGSLIFGGGWSLVLFRRGFGLKV